jgi:hypothetical protein
MCVSTLSNHELCHNTDDVTQHTRPVCCNQLHRWFDNALLFVQHKHYATKRRIGLLFAKVESKATDVHNGVRRLVVGRICTRVDILVFTMSLGFEAGPYV